MTAGVEGWEGPLETKGQAGPSEQQQGWVVLGATWCLGGGKEGAHGEVSILLHLQR